MTDRVLDQFFLYGGLLSSLVILGMRHPEARVGLGLTSVPPSYALVLQRSASAPGDLLIAGIAWIIEVMSALLFLARQIYLPPAGGRSMGRGPASHHRRQFLRGGPTNPGTDCLCCSGRA